MTKNRPINDLLKEIKKLAKNPEENKEELEKLRKQVIAQKKIMEKVSVKKIKDLIDDDDLSYDDYKKYRTILDEKRNFIKNDRIVNRVIKRDYSTIYYLRKYRQRKLAAFIAGGALIVTLGGFAINNHIKKKKIKNTNNNITTEATVPTENTTTEVAYNDEDEYIVIEKLPEEEVTIKQLPTEEITINELPTEEVTINELPTEEVTINELPTEEVTIKDLSTEEENNQTTEDWSIHELNPDTVEKAKEIFEVVNPYIDGFEEFIQNPDKRAEVLSNAKKGTIKLIDFIFYGAEINGITFKELSAEQKEKIYASLQKLDAAIMKYEPNYKEELSDMYSGVKDFSTTKIDQAKEFIKEKIGEERYNNYVEKAENAAEKSKEVGVKLVLKLDEWYQIWKNN